MSITSRPNPLDMKKYLPPRVVDWVELDLRRSFADLNNIDVSVSLMDTSNGLWRSSIPTDTHYRFTFRDGAQHEIDEYALNGRIVQDLITGYTETIHPWRWLDTHIIGVERAEKTPNYSLADMAYDLVRHLITRGQNDALFVRFARKLVDDERLSGDMLKMVVSMNCFAGRYTAKQICTAAYAAFKEMEKGQKDER